jgi:Tfp pilus assembly protein FimV
MFSGLTSSHTYTPSTGETLGRIVAKTLPNSPLSEDLLVQAFVSLNPQAFSTGKNSRTLSAAALKVPNHNQLVQLVLAKNEAARPAVLAAVAAQETQAKSALLPTPRPAEKRENWVRYAGGPVKAPLNFDGSAPERKGWVHYLGAAVQLALGASGLSPDALRWVHYPRVAVAADANPSAPAAALPEGTADTRHWVRYTAGRSYPVQQFAQLFE